MVNLGEIVILVALLAVGIAWLVRAGRINKK